MKIFIDVDNTIVEHYGFYESATESRVHKTFSKHPEKNIEAIKTMYETSICADPITISELFKLDNVYILTKYSSFEYEIEKRKRLAQIFEMTVEELENLTDNDGHPKYIGVKQFESKVDVVRAIFNIEDLKDNILIDDFSENLIEWERNLGIGIKFYNEYNSPTHPTNGITISNFKIFEYYLNKRRLCNLIVVGQNRYKLREFNTKLSNIYQYQNIDFMKLVFEDLSNKIGIRELSENSKYSHYEFIVEYYNFMNHVMKEYWLDKLLENISTEEFNVISSTFEMNINDFHSLDALNLKINSIDDKDKTAYDIYITLNEERFIDDIENTYEMILKIFKYIVRNI